MDDYISDVMYKLAELKEKIVLASASGELRALRTLRRARKPLTSFTVSTGGAQSLDSARRRKLRVKNAGVEPFDVNKIFDNQYRLRHPKTAAAIVTPPAVPIETVGQQGTWEPMFEDYLGRSTKRERRIGTAKVLGGLAGLAGLTAAGLWANRILKERNTPEAKARAKATARAARLY